MTSKEYTLLSLQLSKKAACKYNLHAVLYLSLYPRILV